jgi:hypothetical protein
MTKPGRHKELFMASIVTQEVERRQGLWFFVWIRYDKSVSGCNQAR